MRGAFGVMAAAAATVVVTAWRRVQRDGVEARIARRAREREAAGPPPPDIGCPSSPPPAEGRGWVVTRAAGRVERPEPIEPVRVPSRAERFEPVEIRVTRSKPAEPVRAEPLHAVAPESPDAKPARAGTTHTWGPRSQDATPSVAAPEGGAARSVAGPEGGEARPDRTARPPAWPGGSRPGPAHVPRPMYWPVFLALGVTWAAWGSISSPLLIFGGLAVFAVALALWIREMIHAD